MNYNRVAYKLQVVIKFNSLKIERTLWKHPGWFWIYIKSSDKLWDKCSIISIVEGRQKLVTQTMRLPIVEQYVHVM